MTKGNIPCFVIGTFELHSLFVIWTSSFRSLPDLAGIAFRREALAKLRLLSLSFASLLRLARCLLRVGTLVCAAEENKSQA